MVVRIDSTYVGFSLANIPTTFPPYYYNSVQVNPIPLTSFTLDGVACSSLVQLRAFYNTYMLAAAAGGTPSSPTNSVQFNSAGSFGGSSNFVWDGTSIIVSGNSLTSTYGYAAVWQNTTAATSGTGRVKNPPRTKALGHRWLGGVSILSGFDWGTEFITFGPSSSKNEFTIRATDDDITYLPAATFVGTTTVTFSGSVNTAQNFASTISNNAFSAAAVIPGGDAFYSGQGNVHFGTGGTLKMVSMSSAANSATGVATLVNGVVTITTTAVLTGDHIVVAYKAGSTLNLGVGNVSTQLFVTTITNATSFTITGIIGAGVTNVTDNSDIEWTILNHID